MNPSANSSGVPGPIFSGDPAPVPPAETPPAGAPAPTPDPVFTPKNDDIILQPSQPAKNPALQKYKKPLIIVGIVLVVVICILLIISAVSKKSNNESANDAKVKPLVYSYINYLFFGEESDAYKDISETLDQYRISFLEISPLYADTKLFKEDKQSYFENLDKKLENLVSAYEDTYQLGMEFEGLRTFYLDFALVANIPEADLTSAFIKGGIGALNSVQDITTTSEDEQIKQYVTATNQMRKLSATFIKDAHHAGCYVNYDSTSDTVTESTPGCFKNIKFKNSETFDANYNTAQQIQLSLQQEATRELYVLIERFYNHE